MTNTTKWAIGIGIGAAIFFVFVAAVFTGIYFAVAARMGQNSFDQGYAAMNRREYDKAIAQFDAALRQPLTSRYKAYSLGDRAYSYQQKGRRDEAIRDYTAALNVDPKLSFAYTERGMLREQKREKEHALDDYTQAIQLDPNATAALYRRGLLLMETRDFDKAIADFSEAIRSYPNHWSAYLERGIAYARKNEVNSALASFDSTLRIWPRNGRAYLQRGYLYGHIHDLEKAIADFTEAIRFDPKNANAFRARARAYAEAGRYAEAIADYKQRAQGNEIVSGSTKGLAWLLATCPDPAFRDPKQAMIEATEDCKRTAWTNSNCLDTLAAACAAAGNFDEAIRYEQQALDSKDVNSSKRAEMEQRLALYQKHQPYRKTKPRLTGD